MSESNDPKPPSHQTRVVVLLAVGLILANEDNPRHTDLSDAEKAKLLALGQSMVSDGQKQPVRVVRRADGRYTLVSGHRRLLAARLVGMQTLSALVLDREPTRAELLLDQLIENGQREDFSDLEKCETYQTLLRENAWSVRQLAEAAHVSEAQVSKVLTLKRLCPALQGLVRSGELKGSLAYHIARVGDPAKQVELAGLVAGGLTRDALEVRVKEALKGKVRERRPAMLPVGTRLEKTPAGLEKVRAWARDLAAEIERLLKLNLEAGVVADTVARRFGRGHEK